MKNQGFLKSNWSFKRILRTSFILSVIYLILNALWILIFGAKEEIIWNIKWTREIASTVILPWGSWFNLIPNFLSFFLFLIFGLWIMKLLNGLVIKEKLTQEDLALGLFVGLVYGLVAGLAFGLALGLALGLFSGLVVGLFSGLVFVLCFGLISLIRIIFSKRFLNILGKGISSFCKWIIK